MHRYVAFLGGINVGGHRVTMDRLALLFEGLGFAGVRTFIASGNVAFEAPEGDPAALEPIVEARLAGALGYEVPTFLRTRADLAAIASRRAFPAEAWEAAGSSLNVIFQRRALGPEEAAALLGFRTPMDDFEVAGREAFWLCRGKISESLVPWRKVAKAVPVPATVRNATTVRRLVERFPPD